MLHHTPTLRETIKIPLSENQVARINRIDDEDFSFVKSKVREELAARGVEVNNEYLDEGILALKQYYAVALLDPLNSHAVADNVDPFWHAHILHTRAYARFCEDVVGAFMHHVPLDHMNRDQVENVRTLYRYTVEIYRQMFSYVNFELFPTTIPDVRLICYHGNAYSLSPMLLTQSIFPLHL